MASYQKRGNRWYFTVSRMVDGKSKPIRKGGFRTKKEAQIAAAEIEAQLSRGLLPHLTPVPIDEYFDKWVRLYKTNISVTTRKHYEYTYKAIKEYFGSKPFTRDYQT
ncbi:Arm DNA-binding domain-containing protein [Lysinibacillus halotolerans]|uniref:Arm DNA-binding domain-containing protein n=1 Tax=Lysinibacillus halotolerans TaxID=1368476 RepID=UPI00267F29B7